MTRRGPGRADRWRHPSRSAQLDLRTVAEVEGDDDYGCPLCRLAGIRVEDDGMITRLED